MLYRNRFHAVHVEHVNVIESNLLQQLIIGSNKAKECKNNENHAKAKHDSSRPLAAHDGGIRALGKGDMRPLQVAMLQRHFPEEGWEDEGNDKANESSVIHNLQKERKEQSIGAKQGRAKPEALQWKRRDAGAKEGGKTPPYLGQIVDDAGTNDGRDTSQHAVGNCEFTALLLLGNTVKQYRSRS